MHSFDELVAMAASTLLQATNDLEARVHELLETSAATSLVKQLQSVSVQRAIVAVGMFSLLESMLQDGRNSQDGFHYARKLLSGRENEDLRKRFDRVRHAVNVLKHGSGKSYDALLADAGPLPFRIKGRDDAFFHEGDVSEITTLVEVNDEFLSECTDVILRIWQMASVDRRNRD